MRAALLLVIAACGRIGFDATGENDGDGRSIVVAGFETTSSGFVPVDGGTLTIPPSQGQWLVIASATLQSSALAPDRGAELRYTVDGVERGIGGTQNAMVDRPGPFQHFIVLAGTDQPQTVTFELRDDAGGTARVEQLRAYAIALPPGTLYEAADPILDVATAVFAPTVTFRPPVVAGEYLFFALLNASDDPGSSDCYTRWIGAAGQIVAIENQMPRAPWQSQLVVWRETVAPGAAITLETHVSADSSRVRFVRLLALPTAGLVHDASFEPQRVSTTSTLLVDELVPTISAARYLRFASLRVESNCMTGMLFAEREASFAGGAASSIHHVLENCSYETTYGVVELLTTRPPKLSTTVTARSSTVEASDSTLLLIGLPEN